MNNMEPIQGRASGFARWLHWPVLAFCVALAGNRAAAVDDYYENDAVIQYPGNVASAPPIDARNFINTGTFIINFPSLLIIDTSSPFYETSDTLNYTNTGTMMVNSGFMFDNQSSVTGLRTRSASFNNSKLVSCGSAYDTTDPLLGELTLLGYDQCWVSATNIVNTGELDTGTYGLIKLQGNNVSVAQGLLNIEPTTALPVEGSGFFGTNSWFPGLDLGDTYAYSPVVFFTTTNLLFLNNSAAYTNIAQVTPTYNIIRAVFVEDFTSSAVTTNAISVYFDTAGIGFGGGNVTIQWAGTYLDSASGNYYTNYLYLNDNYALGASTNVLPITGVPANFTFTSATSPQVTTAATLPSAIGTLFQVGIVTNDFDVMNAQLIGSYSTNNIPNRSITNLPGRVEITADNSLDMTLVQITGPTYMSLRATNQFNGSAGAYIQTPYADLNLANHDPVFYLTNVMQSYIPQWSGLVQAYNARFFTVDTNTGATNDYRIVIVGSALSPTAAAQVQDLILHDTNSMVISDTYNVMRTLSADCQSLTLTTNPPGNGATALDGELNLGNPSIFWQSSVPNLRYLTNNGAIRTLNLAYFGYPYLTNVSSVAATGALSKTGAGTNVVNNDKVTIGTNQYIFVSTLTNALPNQVKIVASSLDASLSNLIAAINGGSGSGTAYSSATTSNLWVTAAGVSNHAFAVTALIAGPKGNTNVVSFAPSTTSSNLTWGGQTTLAGGIYVTNRSWFLTNSAFINNGIFSDEGSVIYSGNFVNNGVVSNGVGSFTLQALNTAMTNSYFYAAGDVSIATSNLITSNVVWTAGRSLTLSVTNLLSDSSSNNNTWYVGSASVGSGIKMPIKPATGNLLNTTITLHAPTNYTVANVWAGLDYGLSGAGYNNNMAVGQLVLDVATPAIVNHNGILTFSGAGTSNALYVDLLVLTNYATQGNSTNSYNFPWLKINTNLVIYYAQALEGGVSVAEQIDQQSRAGANNGRLRWIYSYAGYYSSTNILYTNSDSTIYTNTVNAALAQSSDIDSDSDGTPNRWDPTPFFVPGEMNFSVSVTNGTMLKVQWTTIPNATNFVYYTTSLSSTNWLPFTNFSQWYYGNNVPVPNPGGYSFHSPQTYISNATLPDNSQQTNVWFLESGTNASQYYKVVMEPWVNFPK